MKNNTMKKTTIGVLALQGDFREHLNMLGQCNVLAREVKLPQDLEGIDGLIIPGGESTTIGKLMKLYGLDNAIISRYKQGMAIWGTCAGAILLAKGIAGSRQPRLGLMDISVKRNDYGRQAESFEALLEVKGIGGIKGVFIRAPVIDSVGKGAQVLATHSGKPVLAKQGRLLASTFHPELSGSSAIHNYFITIATNISRKSA